MNVLGKLFNTSLKELATPFNLLFLSTFIGFFQSVITLQRKLRVDWQIDVFPSYLTRHLDCILDAFAGMGNCYELSLVLGGS